MPVQLPFAVLLFRRLELALTGGTVMSSIRPTCLVSALFVAFVVLGARGASGDVVVYSDRTAWEAVVGSRTLIQFSNLDSSTTQVTIDGVTFSQQAGLYLLDGAMAFGFHLFDTPPLIEFSVPTSAFAFEYRTTYPCSNLITGDCDRVVSVTLASGGTTVYQQSFSGNDEWGFYGLVSDVPLDEASLVIGPTIPYIRDFQFGTQAVPEASIFVLMTWCITTMAYRRRRISN